MKMLSALVLGVVVATQVQAGTPRQEPIQPIEYPVDVNEAKVELGKKLFFDPRLSLSGWISCNSCHNLSMGGSDNLVSSIGHGWAQGPINAPTVLNSSYNLAQFWDGRAADLKEQAAGPIANPGEMASSHTLAVQVLGTIPGYVDEFAAVYGAQDISIDLVTDAIAEFERTLVTPDSRFDLWLKGDDKAITELEREGYELFKLTGCIGCHNGAAVGGTAFQKMGSFNRFETENPAIGRQDVTGERVDRMRFKVPVLRNIELTYQLGAKLSADETTKIVAFLKTLTGKQPEIVLPILPPRDR